MWFTVQVLQFSIAAICVFFGRLVLRLPWRLALLASSLVLPAPLLLVSPGVAGALYISDIVGGVSLFLLRKPFVGRMRDARTYFSWAALMLLAWPALGTAISLALYEPRQPKLIALSFARAAAYLGTFRLGINLARDAHRARNMLVVQCLALALIYTLGTLQAPLRFDLDLWNYVRGTSSGRFLGGFGGGFMGLYRGAVGAWAVAGIAALPLIAAGPFGFAFATIATAVTFLGVLSVGSRQGLAIGVVSLFASVSIAGGRKNLVRTVVSLAAFVGVVAFSYSIARQNSQGFDGWVTRRFAFIQRQEKLADAMKDRSAQYPAILRAVAESPRMAVVGLGYGSAADRAVGSLGSELIYVDSEALWTLQKGGVPLVLAYGLFLLSSAAVMCRSLGEHGSPRRILAAVGVVTILAGVLLCYGHFYILHIDSSEAPVGHWNWYVIGLGLGASMFSNPLAGRRALLPFRGHENLDRNPYVQR